MYYSILEGVPIEPVLLSILQTFVLYWLLLFGFKIIGRRVFSEMGPQDLITVLVVAEATNTGINHPDAGFWGSLASVLTILVLGTATEHVPFLRTWIEDKAVCIMRHGRLNHKVMKRHSVQEEDLEQVAREYGVPDIHSFESMTLENDGTITGVLKEKARHTGANAEQRGEQKVV